MNARIREQQSVCQEQKANALLKDERISELRRRVHEQKYQVLLGPDAARLLVITSGASPALTCFSYRMTKHSTKTIS